MPGPAIVESFEVTQRDADKTFLVDAVFVAHQPDGDDLDVTLEWQLGGTAGAWTPATPQTFDRRHSGSPVTGVPVAAPGKSYTFVWRAFFDLPEGAHDDVFVRLTLTNAPDSVSEIVGPVDVTTLEPATPEETFQRSLRRRRLIDATPRDFLGRGVAIPFRRGSRDFVAASDVELVRSCVRQILGTRAAVGNFMGDLPWRPDFGSKLWVLRHRKNDSTLRGQAAAFVMEALLWEPRVVVTSVEVLREPFAALNELRIRVKYRIIEENTAGNRVLFPDEFEELVTAA